MMTRITNSSFLFIPDVGRVNLKNLIISSPVKDSEWSKPMILLPWDPKEYTYKNHNYVFTSDVSHVPTSNSSTHPTLPMNDLSGTQTKPCTHPQTILIDPRLLPNKLAIGHTLDGWYHKGKWHIWRQLRSMSACEHNCVVYLLHNHKSCQLSTEWMWMVAHLKIN